MFKKKTIELKNKTDFELPPIVKPIDLIGK